MMGALKYKDFVATLDFSEADNVFYGKILGVNDLILFEGSSIDELNKSFKEAVEDYLELCEEVGKDPYKSFKGSFNVRIPTNLHKKIFFRAQRTGVSLNQYIKNVLEKDIEESAESYC
ncbi:MAG: type II toxin-antitoxin system HicB family antitoxin [Bacteroidetes bacterium]|nr:type II toxin-antitoxin system HicB family antitoxin [Bacteroidota bacterium]